MGSSPGAELTCRSGGDIRATDRRLHGPRVGRRWGLHVPHGPIHHGGSRIELCSARGTGPSERLRPGPSAGAPQAPPAAPSVLKQVQEQVSPMQPLGLGGSGRRGCGVGSKGHTHQVGAVGRGSQEGRGTFHWRLAGGRHRPHWACKSNHRLRWGLRLGRLQYKGREK